MVAPWIHRNAVHEGAAALQRLERRRELFQRNAGTGCGRWVPEVRLQTARRIEKDHFWQGASGPLASADTEHLRQWRCKGGSPEAPQDATSLDQVAHCTNASAVRRLVKESWSANRTNRSGMGRSLLTKSCCSFCRAQVSASFASKPRAYR